MECWLDLGNWVEPEISDLCHFGPTSIWGVCRKMLMVSVGNLSFVNGGGNFLTLPSGKANQIPRMKGLFAFQASFLTLPLISTSIFLSYLQSPNPFLFLTALHFDWHMVQSTFKKKSELDNGDRRERQRLYVSFLKASVASRDLITLWMPEILWESLFSLPMMPSVISSILHATVIESGHFPFFSFYQLLDCICFPNHRVADFIQPSCFYSLDRIASSPGSTNCTADPEGSPEVDASSHSPTFPTCVTHTGTPKLRFAAQKNTPAPFFSNNKQVIKPR